VAWSFDGMTLEISPTSPWRANSTASVTIGPGARSLGGLDFPAAYVDTFHVAPITNPTPVPTVLGSSPGDGASNVSLTSPIVLAFSEPMDAASTAAAFSVQPALPPGNLSVNGTLLSWSGVAPLRPSTTYLVELQTMARDLGGQTLATNWFATFSTIAVDLVPVLVSSTPSNGSVLSSPPTEVILTWNVPMDPASTEAAFHVAPDQAGSLAVMGDELTWTPVGSAPTNGTITVSVGTGARSLANVPVLTEQSVEFAWHWGLPSLLHAPGSSGQGPFLYSEASELWGLLIIAVAGFLVGYWVRGRPSRHSRDAADDRS
jgi:hypothetical protein